jgi:hypothetical protein
MKFLDALIVPLVTGVMRGVMAVGSGLVYIQFLACLTVLAMFGTVMLAVCLVLAKSAIFGA